MTGTIKNASEFLNIQLQDHCILTSAEYLSFADEGLL
ncbi:hypothetical protein LIV57_10305 [Chryseobacterium sp. X308]|nr:hypothetical protein [Chryseobacterium sp. X308]